jgi:hypothetical protein
MTKTNSTKLNIPFKKLKNTINQIKTRLLWDSVNTETRKSLISKQDSKKSLMVTKEPRVNLKPDFTWLLITFKPKNTLKPKSS